MFELLAFGSPEKIPLDMMDLLLLLFPVFISEFLFGLGIYQHFCMGAVYYFSRQENRTAWFLREIRQMMCGVCGFCVAYFGITYLGGVLLEGGATGISAVLVLEVCLLYILYLIPWSLILTILNIRLGSQVACGIVFAIQVGSVFFHLTDFDNGWLFMLNPTSNLILSWHSLPAGQSAYEVAMVDDYFPLWYSVLYEVVLTGIALAVGCVMIRRMDIALQNREEQG